MGDILICIFEYRARIAYFVVKIQTQIRMRKARLIARVLAEKRAARNSLLKKAKYALKIQCCIRRFLARRRSVSRSLVRIFDGVANNKF